MKTTHTLAKPCLPNLEPFMVNQRHLTSDTLPALNENFFNDSDPQISALDVSKLRDNSNFLKKKEEIESETKTKDRAFTANSRFWALKRSKFGILVGCHSLPETELINIKETTSRKNGALPLNCLFGKSSDDAKEITQIELTEEEDVLAVVLDYQILMFFQLQTPEEVEKKDEIKHSQLLETFRSNCGKRDKAGLLLENTSAFVTEISKLNQDLDLKMTRKMTSKFSVRRIPGIFRERSKMEKLMWKSTAKGNDLYYSSGSSIRKVSVNTHMLKVDMLGHGSLTRWESVYEGKETIVDFHMTILSYFLVIITDKSTLSIINPRGRVLGFVDTTKFCGNDIDHTSTLLSTLEWDVPPVTYSGTDSTDQDKRLTKSTKDRPLNDYSKEEAQLGTDKVVKVQCFTTEQLAPGQMFNMSPYLFEFVALFSENGKLRVFTLYELASLKLDSPSWSLNVLPLVDSNNREASQYFNARKHNIFSSAFSDKTYTTKIWEQLVKEEEKEISLKDFYSSKFWDMVQIDVCQREFLIRFFRRKKTLRLRLNDRLFQGKTELKDVKHFFEKPHILNYKLQCPEFVRIVSVPTKICQKQTLRFFQKVTLPEPQVKHKVLKKGGKKKKKSKQKQRSHSKNSNDNASESSEKKFKDFYERNKDFMNNHFLDEKISQIDINLVNSEASKKSLAPALLDLCSRYGQGFSPNLMKSYPGERNNFRIIYKDPKMKKESKKSKKKGKKQRKKKQTDTLILKDDQILRPEPSPQIQAAQWLYFFIGKATGFTTYAFDLDLISSVAVKEQIQHSFTFMDPSPTLLKSIFKYEKMLDQAEVSYIPSSPMITDQKRNRIYDNPYFVSETVDRIKIILENHVIKYISADQLEGKDQKNKANLERSHKLFSKLANEIISSKTVKNWNIIEPTEANMRKAILNNKEIFHQEDHTTIIGEYWVYSEHSLMLRPLAIFYPKSPVKIDGEEISFYPKEKMEKDPFRDLMLISPKERYNWEKELYNWADYQGDMVRKKVMIEKGLCTEETFWEVWNKLLKKSKDDVMLLIEAKKSEKWSDKGFNLKNVKTLFNEIKKQDMNKKIQKLKEKKKKEEQLIQKQLNEEVPRPPSKMDRNPMQGKIMSQVKFNRIVEEISRPPEGTDLEKRTAKPLKRKVRKNRMIGREAKQAWVGAEADQEEIEFSSPCQSDCGEWGRKKERKRPEKRLLAICADPKDQKPPSAAELTKTDSRIPKAPGLGPLLPKIKINRNFKMGANPSMNYVYENEEMNPKRVERERRRLRRDVKFQNATDATILTIFLEGREIFVEATKRIEELDDLVANGQDFDNAQSIEYGLHVRKMKDNDPKYLMRKMTNIMEFVENNDEEFMMMNIIQNLVALYEKEMIPITEEVFLSLLCRRGNKVDFMVRERYIMAQAQKDITKIVSDIYMDVNENGIEIFYHHPASRWINKKDGWFSYKETEVYRSMLKFILKHNPNLRTEKTILDDIIETDLKEDHSPDCSAIKIDEEEQKENQKIIDICSNDNIKRYPGLDTRYAQLEAYQALKQEFRVHDRTYQDSLKVKPGDESSYRKCFEGHLALGFYMDFLDYSKSKSKEFSQERNSKMTGQKQRAKRFKKLLSGMPLPSKTLESTLRHYFEDDNNLGYFNHYSVDLLKRDFKHFERLNTARVKKMRQTPIRILRIPDSVRRVLEIGCSDLFLVYEIDDYLDPSNPNREPALYDPATPTVLRFEKEFMSMQIVENTMIVRNGQLNNCDDSKPHLLCVKCVKNQQAEEVPIQWRQAIEVDQENSRIFNNLKIKIYEERWKKLFSDEGVQKKDVLTEKIETLEKKNAKKQKKLKWQKQVKRKVEIEPILKRDDLVVNFSADFPLDYQRNTFELIKKNSNHKLLDWEDLQIFNSYPSESDFSISNYSQWEDKSEPERENFKIKLQSNSGLMEALQSGKINVPVNEILTQSGQNVLSLTNQKITIIPEIEMKQPINLDTLAIHDSQKPKNDLALLLRKEGMKIVSQADDSYPNPLIERIMEIGRAKSNKRAKRINVKDPVKIRELRKTLEAKRKGISLEGIDKEGYVYSENDSKLKFRNVENADENKILQKIIKANEQGINFLEIPEDEKSMIEKEIQKLIKSGGRVLKGLNEEKVYPEMSFNGPEIKMRGNLAEYHNLKSNKPMQFVRVSLDSDTDEEEEAMFRLGAKMAKLEVQDESKAQFRNVIKSIVDSQSLEQEQNQKYYNRFKQKAITLNEQKEGKKKTKIKKVIPLSSMKVGSTVSKEQLTDLIRQNNQEKMGMSSPTSPRQFFSIHMEQHLADLEEYFEQPTIFALSRMFRQQKKDAKKLIRSETNNPAKLIFYQFRVMQKIKAKPSPYKLHEKLLVRMGWDTDNRWNVKFLMEKARLTAAFQNCFEEELRDKNGLMIVEVRRIYAKWKSVEDYQQEQDRKQRETEEMEAMEKEVRELENIEKEKERLKRVKRVEKMKKEIKQIEEIEEKDKIIQDSEEQNQESGKESLGKKMSADQPLLTGKSNLVSPKEEDQQIKISETKKDQIEIEEVKKPKIKLEIEIPELELEIPKLESEKMEKRTEEIVELENDQKQEEPIERMGISETKSQVEKSGEKTQIEDPTDMKISPNAIISEPKPEIPETTLPEIAPQTFEPTEKPKFVPKNDPLSESEEKIIKNTESKNERVKEIESEPERVAEKDPESDDERESTITEPNDQQNMDPELVPPSTSNPETQTEPREITAESIADAKRILREDGPNLKRKKITLYGELNIDSREEAQDLLVENLLEGPYFSQFYDRERDTDYQINYKKSIEIGVFKKGEDMGDPRGFDYLNYQKFKRFGREIDSLGREMEKKLYRMCEEDVKKRLKEVGIEEDTDSEQDEAQDLSKLPEQRIESKTPTGWRLPGKLSGEQPRSINLEDKVRETFRRIKGMKEIEEEISKREKQRNKGRMGLKTIPEFQGFKSLANTTGTADPQAQIGDEETGQTPVREGEAQMNIFKKMEELNKKHSHPMKNYSDELLKLQQAKFYRERRLYLARTEKMMHENMELKRQREQDHKSLSDRLLKIQQDNQTTLIKLQEEFKLNLKTQIKRDMAKKKKQEKEMFEQNVKKYRQQVQTEYSEQTKQLCLEMTQKLARAVEETTQRFEDEKQQHNLQIELKIKQFKQEMKQNNEQMQRNLETATNKCSTIVDATVKREMGDKIDKANATSHQINKIFIEVTNIANRFQLKNQEIEEIPKSVEKRLMSWSQKLGETRRSQETLDKDFQKFKKLFSLFFTENGNIPSFTGLLKEEFKKLIDAVIKNKKIDVPKNVSDKFNGFYQAMEDIASRIEKKQELKEQAEQNLVKLAEEVKDMAGEGLYSKFENMVETKIKRINNALSKKLNNVKKGINGRLERELTPLIQNSKTASPGRKNENPESAKIETSTPLEQNPKFIKILENQKKMITTVKQVDDLMKNLDHFKRDRDSMLEEIQNIKLSENKCIRDRELIAKMLTEFRNDLDNSHDRQIKLSIELEGLRSSSTGPTQEELYLKVMDAILQKQQMAVERFEQERQQGQGQDELQEILQGIEEAERQKGNERGQEEQEDQVQDIQQEQSKSSHLNPQQKTTNKILKEKLPTHVYQEDTEPILSKSQTPKSESRSQNESGFKKSGKSKKSILQNALNPESEISSETEKEKLQRQIKRLKKIKKKEISDSSENQSKSLIHEVLQELRESKRQRKEMECQMKEIKHMISSQKTLDKNNLSHISNKMLQISSQNVYEKMSRQKESHMTHSEIQNEISQHPKQPATGPHVKNGQHEEAHWEMAQRNPQILEHHHKIETTSQHKIQNPRGLERLLTRQYEAQPVNPGVPGTLDQSVGDVLTSLIKNINPEQLSSILAQRTHQMHLPKSKNQNLTSVVQGLAPDRQFRPYEPVYQQRYQSRGNVHDQVYPGRPQVMERRDPYEFGHREPMDTRRNPGMYSQSRTQRMPSRQYREPERPHGRRQFPKDQVVGYDQGFTFNRSTRNHILDNRPNQNRGEGREYYPAHNPNNVFELKMEAENERLRRILSQKKRSRF